MPPKAVSGVDAKRSVIPASRRPDGSLRKPIQVKPGFIPVEDQIAFVSSRIKGLDVVVGGGSRKVKPEETGLSAAALKNLRRKERKQAAAEQKLPSDTADSTQIDGGVSVKKGNLGSEFKDNQNKSRDSVPTTIPVENQIRNLQKKLRKIDELVAKQANGDSLDHDQLEKISKRSEIELEIGRLSLS